VNAKTMTQDFSVFLKQRIHFFISIFVFLFNSPYTCFGRVTAVWVFL
jgi:hypothetical protein